MITPTGQSPYFVITLLLIYQT